MALTLDIAANTRSAVSGVKDVGKALEGVSDSLDDLARDADRSAQRTERAIDGIGDAAQDSSTDIDRAGDKVERTFAEMVRNAKKAERAVSDVGDGAKKGFGKANEATSEFKSEALQNFSEVTSSFDGSMSSIGDLAQGTLGGIAGAIPGIGVAGGIAALGIGAITSALQEAAERSTATKTGIINDFLEVGNALDAEAVKSRVRDILGGEETRKEARILADLLGVTVGQAVLAMAGDFESAGVTAQQAMDAINSASSSTEYEPLVKLRDHMNDTASAFEAGKQAADEMADAMDRKASSDKRASDSAADATAKAREFFDTARQGKPVDQVVRFTVDDSAVRRWTPPTKFAAVQYRAGNQMSWE
ncbi:hypothetical protein [uncultured Microbacterium sp.]|uniref:hypothetical protein n=1 Tax=uncultured Microbacterium sp. TaxID=191216 RepID=UPI0025F10395|nr:hypothetical protein [uncultured Microbacterium sp.]